MDSTSVYLTASTRKIFKDTPRFEDVHPSDLELAWYKLDGTPLCNAQVKPTWPASSPAQKHDMRDFDSQNRVFLNDAILCYDFSRPWKRREADSDAEGNDSMFVQEDPQEGLHDHWGTTTIEADMDEESDEDFEDAHASDDDENDLMVMGETSP